MQRTVTALLLAGTLALPVIAQPSAGSAVEAQLGTRASMTAANSRIGAVLATRTRSKVLGSRFTMTVWDTASGRYVYQRRATAALRGASTTKILTAVGVLASLGPDHVLPTTVRAGATADEVVLVGGGDPLLTSTNLKQLAASTVLALTGSLAPTPSAPPTPSQPATASAPPSPADEASPSAPAVTSPAAGTGSAAVAAAAKLLAGRTIQVRADDSLFPGSGISRGWRRSYVPREVRSVGPFARDDNKARYPTSDAGTYFAKALKSLGVDARYGGEATAGAGSATLATFPGHTVGQAVSHMLLVSDNDTAEMLFRQVAVARGLPGSWAGARTALADTLRALDVPLSGVRIVDGSGLSLESRLTAPALTSALNRALSPDHPELTGLRAWLPVAGRTGTLRAGNLRFNSKPSKCAAGLIQAKTGTVADAIALAGYATGADGQTKIFVSIVNSRPTKYSRITTRKYVDLAAASVTGCW